LKAQHLLLRFLLDNRGNLVYIMIKELMNMKFDAVVGNPPYQESNQDGNRKDQASNLWTTFWSIAINKMSKNDATVSLVTPTSWLSPSKDIRSEYKIDGEDRLWNIFNKYTSKANVTDVADHFPGIGSTFGYVVVDKSGSDGLTFSHETDTSMGFLPKSDVESSLKELSHTVNIENLFKIDQANTDNSMIRVCVPMTRSVKEDMVSICTGKFIPVTGSLNESLYLYIYVNTLAQAIYIKSRIIDCEHILNKSCRWAGFINIKILKMISVARDANQKK